MVKHLIGVTEVGGLIPTGNFEIFSNVPSPFAKQPSLRHFTHGYIQHRSITSSNDNDINESDKNNNDIDDNSIYNHVVSISSVSSKVEVLRTNRGERNLDQRRENSTAELRTNKFSQDVIQIT